MVEEHTDPGMTPRRRNTTIPLVSNVILLLCTAAVLWWSLSAYDDETRVAASEESRFITMEWNLLQELKARTDHQLLEKDREIAELRRRHTILLRDGARNEERQELADRLDQAIAERESILSQRIDIPVQPPESDQEIAPARPFPDLGRLAAPVESRSPLTSILQDQISALRQELQSRDVYIVQLETAFAAAQSDAARAAATYRLELEELRRQISLAADSAQQELQSRDAYIVQLETAFAVAQSDAAQTAATYRLELEELRRQISLAADSAREELQSRDAYIDDLETGFAAALSDAARTASAYQAELEELRRQVSLAVGSARATTGVLGAIDTAAVVGDYDRVSSGLDLSTLELLNTRTLLRAILATPQIRAEHPDLPAELDRFLEAIEERARVKGREEAYDEATRILDHVAARLDIPLETDAPDGAAQGHLERVLQLLRSVVRRSVPNT